MDGGQEHFFSERIEESYIHVVVNIVLELNVDTA